MKSPAFQFYPNDFLGSGAVAAMTLEAVGAYILLLSYEWNGGGLPNDMDRLARFCRVSRRVFDKLWPVVAENFELCDDNLWRNPRLEAEREKQDEYRAKMSVNGKKGGRPRGKKQSRSLADGKPELSNGLADRKPIESTPSSSPSPTTELPPSPPDGGNVGRTSEPSTWRPEESAVPAQKKGRRELVPTDDELAVHAHYKTLHPRAGPPDDAQIRKLRKALAVYSVADCCQIIDGNHLDEWANEVGKHEIIWIFQNADNMTRYLELAQRDDTVLVDENNELTPAGRRAFGLVA